jgi:hypothetical protein
VKNRPVCKINVDRIKLKFTMGILRQEEITVDFKIRSLDVEDPGVEE